MSFKYSAFTENTPEMRKWLEGIGIGISPKGELAAHYQDELIIAKNGYYRELPESIVLLYESDAIDCRNNPELFKAVTAVRDDSDFMQWFKMNDSDEWYRHVPAHKDLKHQSAFKVIREDKWHKATLEELQEHFKKK